MPKYEKGHPGGPGRPKQKPFIEWCGKWTKEKAEKYLLPLAENSRSKYQFEAIKLIMAYGVGKPVETQLLEDVTESIGSSAEDIAREIASLIGEPKITSLGSDKENQMDGNQ